MAENVPPPQKTDVDASWCRFTGYDNHDHHDQHSHSHKQPVEVPGFYKLGFA